MQYIGFIRGINVGGNKMLRMDALRATCESLGFTDIKTHLQSGNVIFNTTKKNPASLLEKALDLDVRVFVRTLPELERIIAGNPAEVRNPSLFLVMFLDDEPTRSARTALEAAHTGPEEIHFAGKELYLYYPNGAGRSKLTNALIERKLGMAGSARNWNTVTKLAEMAKG